MPAIADLVHLRDYQRECLTASRAAFDRGVWSQLAVSAVGSGKTVIFAHLRHAYDDWLAQFPALQQKVLVLAHRDRLLDQAAAKIAGYNPGLRIGTEQGGRRHSPFDDVVVASVQTLTANDCRRLHRLNPDEFRIVVVDEAHRTAAHSYQRVLRYFGLVPPMALHADATADDQSAARTRVRDWWTATWPNRLLLGVTATPGRTDAVGLEWTYREVVFERGLRWYIERGYLAPLTGYVVKTDVSLDSVRRVAGDFAPGQLAQVVNTPARNRAIVQGWTQIAASRRAALAFCVDVQHARDLAAEFRRAGIAADSIAGEDADRSDRMADFERGDLQVLTNCQLLSEGVDIPFIDCIVMAAPTQSQIRYVQAVGRGTRNAPGKADCLVLDCVDDARKYTLHTSGDLFGLPSRFNAQGANLVGCAVAVEQARAEHPTLAFDAGLTPETLAIQVQALDLWTLPVSQTATTHGTLAWLEPSPARYVLSLPARADSGALEQPTHALPEVLVITANLLGACDVEMRVGIQVRERIAVGLDFVGEAFRRGERWVEHHRPDVWRMLDRSAAWRNRDASDKQKAALRRQGATIPDGLTRGQASDMLDAYYARRR
jgi:ATP-dependent helicase IRC3